jgi:S-DNA-T family DNA segregation ATPase FtsK/SpoIIIE
MRIQGRRIELGLTAITFVVFGIAQNLFGTWAPTLVGVTVGLAILALPGLRKTLEHWLIGYRHEARLAYIFWYSRVVGRSGRPPSLVGIKNLPGGRIYYLELPTGLFQESIEKRLPELTAAFNARVIRVQPSKKSARYIEMTVMYTNAFRREYPSPLLREVSCSLWNPVVLGVGEDGGPVSISLFEHNLLIGGEPGSGKSVALSSIVAAAALDSTVHLVLLDGKEVELSLWLDVAGQFVGRSQGDAVLALKEVQAEMDDRYAELSKVRLRKIDRMGSNGLILVAIDELALYLRGGERGLREEFAELLRDLVARGRAAGIIVVAATQKPSHDVVPTFIRDLFSYRLALRCTSPEASDTILGQGWASQGFSASTIDPQQRGVGFLLAEGGIPRQIMAANILDGDLKRLIDRAVEARRS